MDKQIEKFLEVLKSNITNVGNIPTFQIDYRKGNIYLTDASCGFIKRILENGGTTHLHEGKLSVNFY
jgi:hypothetical protein